MTTDEKQQLIDQAKAYEAIANGKSWQYYSELRNKWIDGGEDESPIEYIRVRIKPEPLVINCALIGKDTSKEPRAKFVVEFAWRGDCTTLPELGTKFELRQIIED